MANSPTSKTIGRNGLWIAFKLVILSYGKQHRSYLMPDKLVVNCFQISNFVLWQTAWAMMPSLTKSLWIAFKLVILSYGKQRQKTRGSESLVVNCFQISNFVLWQTASSWMDTLFKLLWIAFKLVILSYGKQLRLFLLKIQSGCELLSN